CVPKPPSKFCKQPDWGRGGIVFQCKVDDEWQIYQVPIDKSGKFGNVRPLTEGKGGTDASWDSEGKLVYSCHRGKNANGKKIDGADLCKMDPSQNGGRGIPTSAIIPTAFQNHYSGAVVRCPDGNTYFETSNGSDVPTRICWTRGGAAQPGK